MVRGITVTRAKGIAGLAAAALAIAGLAGCGDDNNQSGSGNGNASSSASAPAPNSQGDQNGQNGQNGQNDPNGAQNGSPAAQALQQKLDELTNAAPIMFEREKTELTAQSKETVKKAAEAAAGAAGTKLEVTASAGYDDAAKATEVSQKRAEAVVKEMTENGVPADRVTAKGTGNQGVVGDEKAATSVKIKAS